MTKTKRNIVESVREQWRGASRLFTSVALLLTATSCSDTVESLFGGTIEEGDKVMFTTMAPDIPAASRSAKEDWENEVKAYQPVKENYTFMVSMFKEGEDDVKGSALYTPIHIDEEGNISFASDGTLNLKEGQTDIYWQDNVNRWGFKAETVSSESIEDDQDTQDKWLFQDKLIGYSYLPIWNEDEIRGVDDFNRINYRTNKDWYADNKTVYELSGIMAGPEDYKKVPLFMQHQRSWVTIILKAGEGVTREALKYETSAANIKATIYSYGAEDIPPTAITKAWSSEAFVNYDSDKNGEAATGVSSTRYDAIVAPHNFMKDHDSQEGDIIARINVSDQNFTFAAANDFKYREYVAGSSDEATKAMQAYNLLPGKHLTITATLSRDSRMVMITAWIEDWTETVTQTICDDYGQNGDPILIKNRGQLADFLKDPEKNKAGNVGLIVPNAISLVDTTWNFNDYELKATLNLAGAKLSIDEQFLKSIDRTGSLVNGEVVVNDAFNYATTIATENHGTIERVRVTTSSEQTPAKATKGGLVVTNHGTIYQCTSALPVNGTEGYVGGIAATNLYHGSEGTMPVIESCTVTARVDGSSGVTAGGGIVGQAEGRVSNNTFEYGITLSQDATKFQNIIAAVGTNRDGLTTHTNNSWPIDGNYTINGSSVVIVNNYTGQLFSAVIDRQAELKRLLTSSYNQADMIYRISGSFDVNKDSEDPNWIWGTDELANTYFVPNASGEYSHGNVKFKLDGNNKTITLTGTENATMLFGCILGEVYDLKLELAKPIVAARLMDKNNSDVDTNTDAIAALAYDVYGSGKVTNVTLKGSNEVYVQSSTPAGIAVWASEGGTIANCASNVKIRMQLTTTGSEARRYAGGIVACVQKATIMQCKYYNSDKNSILWTDDKNAKGSTMFHYGGIVGGTSEIAGTTETKPLLVITDCSSWWPLPDFAAEDTQRPTMGSLIGTTRYHEGEIVHNAMAETNAGNWWTGTVGAGRMADGITEPQAIGRKNSITPTKPVGW